MSTSHENQSMTRDQYIEEQMRQGTSRDEAELAWKNLGIAKEFLEGKRELDPSTSFAKVRGFAAITPEQRREIARKGGKKSQASGKAHKYTPDEARHAGALGGRKVAENREHMREIGKRGGTSVARDTKHMSEIGKKGGRKVRAIAKLSRKGAK